MISIPPNFQDNPVTDKKFIDLITFFNKLEEDLRYPICEGYADETRRLRLASNAVDPDGDFVISL